MDSMDRASAFLFICSSGRVRPSGINSRANVGQEKAKINCIRRIRLGVVPPELCCRSALDRQQLFSCPFVSTMAVQRSVPSLEIW